METKPVQLSIFDVAKTEILPYTPINISTSDYIPFGSDNLFAQALALFSRSSPNHRGIVNKKRIFTLGKDIVTNDKYTQAFLDKCNLEEEMFSEVHERIEQDYVAGGNGWIELITDKHRGFLFINHIDFTKVRKSKDNKHAILHPDWAKYTGESDEQREIIALYPNFTPDKKHKGVFRSVYHMFDYEPEFTYYGIPSWIAGKDAVQIDLKTNRWNLARLVNSFRVSGIMFVPVKDMNESDSVIQNIKNQYTGDMNQDKLLIVTKSRSSENEKADQVQLIQKDQKDNGSWIDLHQMSISDIIVSHSWYRSLSGIEDSTGFDTERILNEYSIALSTYIQPRQKRIERIYQKIFASVINKKIDFEFINDSPITIEDGMFIWELRKKKGLEFDPLDPIQQKIIYNGQLV